MWTLSYFESFFYTQLILLKSSRINIVKVNDLSNKINYRCNDKFSEINIHLFMSYIQIYMGKMYKIITALSRCS